MHQSDYLENQPMGHTVLTLLILAALYFIPTIIAGFRKLPSAGSVAVVNLFLGWTFIGWVVALAMAVAGNRTSTSR